MSLKWAPQVWFGRSRPDIAANLDDGKVACVDVTSEVGHVLRKPGIWNSSKVVYVAEAVFTSVTADALEVAKPAILYSNSTASAVARLSRAGSG